MRDGRTVMRGKLDCELIHDPKWESLSDAAFRLAIRCICWSLRWSLGEVRPGFIPSSMLPSLALRSKARAIKLAEEIVRAGSGFGEPGILVPVEGGWDIHDFHGYVETDRDRGGRCAGRELRSAVVARDGFVCGICDGIVDPDDVHVDHIKPWSLGGFTFLENLRVTHSRCNMQRGARS